MPLASVRTRAVKPRRDPFASVYWFPLAAFYAALVLPWSVAGQLGLVWAPAGLRTAAGHGHEMLFGFALAVVAGYVLGPQPPRKLFAVICLWLLARSASLAFPQAWPTGLLNVAFIGALAWHVVPIYLRTAKKWRNKAVAFILMGLVLVVAAFHLAIRLADSAALETRLLLEGILLLSTLMFFMGGRMIAPAIAGHLKDMSKMLKDRVQPNFEGGVLLLLAAALLCQLSTFPFGAPLTALLLLLAALGTLIRFLRWRVWLCFVRADLAALLLGYGWLVAGWLLVALALVSPRLGVTPALHAITVGALGTLTLSVMLRTRMHRALKEPDAWPWAYALSLLPSVAALARLAFGTLSGDVDWLWLAAACWSLGYLGLWLLLLWFNRIERAGGIKAPRRSAPPAVPPDPSA